MTSRPFRSSSLLSLMRTPPTASVALTASHAPWACAAKEALKNTPEFEHNNVKPPPKPHKLKDAR